MKKICLNSCLLIKQRLKVILKLIFRPFNFVHTNHRTKKVYYNYSRNVKNTHKEEKTVSLSFEISRVLVFLCKRTVFSSFIRISRISHETSKHFLALQFITAQL